MDVSKIRSTGNKEQSSQNELLRMKKGCRFVFSFLNRVPFWGEKKAEGPGTERKTLSAIIFEIFPGGCMFFSAIDEFCACAFDLYIMKWARFGCK